MIVPSLSSCLSDRTLKWPLKRHSFVSGCCPSGCNISFDPTAVTWWCVPTGNDEQIWETRSSSGPSTVTPSDPLRNLFPLPEVLRSAELKGPGSQRRDAPTKWHGNHSTNLNLLPGHLGLCIPVAQQAKTSSYCIRRANWLSLAQGHRWLLHNEDREEDSETQRIYWGVSWCSCAQF